MNLADTISFASSSLRGARTRTLLMVLATAVPIRAPTRFQAAAQSTAMRGVSTFVDTTVAIALADDVAWDPHSLPVGVIGRMSSGESPADLQVLPMNHLGREAPRLGLVMVALMEVRSRGRVTVGAVRPVATPDIDFAMLSDEQDVRRLGIGVEQVRRVLDHDAMRSLGTPMIPPSDRVGLRSNLGDYVHAAGTCAIGRVVDPQCRVIGYEGLRVCDASVMPDLPRANTHLTTVVIAERSADLIRRGY